jgi:hypothetical protein
LDIVHRSTAASWFGGVSIGPERPASGVVCQSTVEGGAIGGGESDEPLSGGWVRGCIDHDRRGQRLTDSPCSVPADALDLDSDIDRKGATRSARIHVGTANLQMQVRLDPRLKKARVDEPPERVASNDGFARFDIGINVEDASDCPGGKVEAFAWAVKFDGENGVLVSGVRFRRCVDAPDIAHSARDGRIGLCSLGIEIDRVPPVVCGIRGVVQREPPVAPECVPGQFDHTSRSEAALKDILVESSTERYPGRK